MKNKLSLILISLLFCSCSKYEITFTDLLEEMTDREKLAEYPDPFYQTLQASSYDRASADKYSPSWYANWDRSQFIRTEINDGRREFVLLDAEGPGAIVRFWVTVADYSGQGIIRFYLDGSQTPAIEEEVLSVIGGNALSEAPLSASLSELSEYKQRGHNLYLPIPYGKSCKITYESPSIIEPGENSGECFYYNINYRSYDKSVRVKTFTLTDLEQNRTLINRIQNRLRTSSVDLSQSEKHISPEKQLNKGEEIILSLNGSAAIKRVDIQLNSPDMIQALRSTILKISFDGNQTVWAPVGDFMGTGNRFTPYQTYYTEVTPDMTLSCYWVMPYKEQCDISLMNLDTNSVNVSLAAYTSAWKWNDRSMYFGAGWTEYHKLYTGKTRDMKGTKDQFDISFVTLKGRGVYVGDAVTLFNPVADWWGEGDEKVYIDGETFPSHFGTGTEDYYGYAWCMHHPFEHPFIAQPDGSGATQCGHVSNVRFRSLDAIPFKESLVFDMEVWHWASTLMNYAPVTYWYMLPGGSSNRSDETELAMNPVARHKNDIVSNLPDKRGIIEGEFLDIQLTGGEEKSQTIAFMPWSNNAQFFWKNAEEGDKALLKFELKEKGKYRVKAHVTQGHDYGTFSVLLNNRLVIPSLDTYQKEFTTKEIEIGVHTLEKGKHILTFVQIPRNPSAVNNFLGVDYIVIEKLKN